MTEQLPNLDQLAAQRTMLVCRSCAGLLWHFDALEKPNPGGSPVLVVGYVCAGCGERIEMLVRAIDAAADG
jgi:hypothetical protein